MTDVRDDRPPSRLELVVLARLSDSKPPSARALARDVLALALPGESETRAREVVGEAMAALQARGLVSERPRPRGAPVRALTADGGRVLRATFDLKQTPLWLEVRDAHLPALALGLKPGAEQTARALRDKDAIAAAVLRTQLGVREALTAAGVCDALISEALGMPRGPLTLKKLRAHVLARRLGVEVAVRSKDKMADVSARIAAATVRARPADKRAIARALARQWVSDSAEPRGAAPVQPVQPRGAEPAQPTQPVRPAQSVAPGSGDALLAAVQEALPRVGTDGRFGPEKVFVAAIWRGLGRDHRLGDLSFDRFKRWLLTANRDGSLVLARADLVPAMDPRLVAESEIEDQGVTFHFVLDRRGGESRSNGGAHAR